MASPEQKYILALDQGTTSSRALLFDRKQNMVSTVQREYTQIYPRPGWVEHDPMEIWGSQSGVMVEMLARSGVAADRIAAIGITNQRETTIIWDKNTGRPVYNAIVWQCRRTADLCEQIKQRPGMEAYIRESTGLMVDAYFSGTKVKWILDHVEGARERAKRGDLLFGTVDTWLIWQLTARKEHGSNFTIASRTMLYNIHKLDWDDRILDLLDIPRGMLPEVRPSSCVYGHTVLRGHAEPIPIAGMAGDQQAALFGQTCFNEGDVKNTYGTGCFMLLNTGEKPVASKHGLLTTIAAGVGDRVQYALEGSVFVAGAAVQWLRDEMKLVHDARDTEYFATKVEDSGGVYVVPAFVGLGSPHWDMYARGAILGITRGTNRNHLIRATLESIAYQSADLLDALRHDSGMEIGKLRVDGGAVANNFLMQFQADILGIEVERPLITETTALGAAYLAGLAVGFWEDKNSILEMRRTERIFSPCMENELRVRARKGWSKAVERAKNWEEG